MARRDFRRAMRTLGSAALGSPDLVSSDLVSSDFGRGDFDGAYFASAVSSMPAGAATLVMPPRAVLRQRRRIVSLGTGCVALLCLGVAVALPGRAIGGLSAVSAILAVTYQIGLRGIRRR
jgi:hypothetical protein